MRHKAVKEYSFEPMPLSYVFQAHNMNYHDLFLVASGVFCGFGFFFYNSILFLKEEFMTKGLKVEDCYFN